MPFKSIYWMFFIVKIILYKNAIFLFYKYNNSIEISALMKTMKHRFMFQILLHYSSFSSSTFSILLSKLSPYFRCFIRLLSHLPMSSEKTSFWWFRDDFWITKKQFCSGLIWFLWHTTLSNSSLIIKETTTI